MPNGSKLWRLKYRFAGKERLMELGRHPGLSLAAARERRMHAKHTLSLGRDPMRGLVDPALNAKLTFKAVAQQWHENRKSSLDPEHAKRVWSRIERDVFPELGEMALEAIEPPDVLAMV